MSNRRSKPPEPRAPLPSELLPVGLGLFVAAVGFAVIDVPLGAIGVGALGTLVLGIAGWLWFDRAWGRFRADS